jgi:flagellar biosynthesis repressor protein FlbT
MALKVELKPNERIIIGTALIRNGEQRARFFIEGEAPILREKDIMTFETANSPARRIYLCVQTMYLSNDIVKNHELYFDYTRQFLEAAPSSYALIVEINNRILNDELYKALKTTKKLIDYETELMNHALGR